MADDTTTWPELATLSDLDEAIAGIPGEPDLSDLTGRVGALESGLQATTAAEAALASTVQANAVQAQAWAQGASSADSAQTAATAALAQRVVVLEGRPSGGAVVTVPGERAIDSMLDSTRSFSDKFTAALAASALDKMPLRQPSYTVTDTVSNRQWFTHLRLLAPRGFEEGSKNLEQDGSIPHIVAAGGGAWWAGPQAFGVYMNLVAQGAKSTRFANASVASLYAAEFHAMALYGFAGIFGTEAEKALVTQVNWTGHNQILGLGNTGYHLGGSDCNAFDGGYLNIDTTNLGRYQMILDSLQKSTLGALYVTARGTSRGVNVRGANSEVTFRSARFEGAEKGPYCNGAVFTHDDGMVALEQCRLGNAMAAPTSTDHGAYQQNGGMAILDNPRWEHGNTAGSVPMASCDGGVMYVTKAWALDRSTLPVVRKGAGTVYADDTVTVVNPAGVVLVGAPSPSGLLKF